MSGFNVKETMDQFHISEEMQDEIIMNIKNQLESGKRKTRNWKKIVTSVVIVALTAGIVSIPVRAVVINIVRERMESIPKEEFEDLRDMMQEQRTPADGFSREYSDTEKERSNELWKSYKNGTFPEGTIQQVDNIEDVTEGTLCYVRATGDFYLPDREMTDEEILEIIDFQHEMQYAIEQSPAAQEARAEYLAERNRLRELVQAAGGISEEEAIEIAKRQMESELGERATEMILETDISGCGAFLVDISNQTNFEHEGDLAYIVGFRNPNDHSTYNCKIDAVDGSVLQY